MLQQSRYKVNFSCEIVFFQQQYSRIEKQKKGTRLVSTEEGISLARELHADAFCECSATQSGLKAGTMAAVRERITNKKKSI